MNMELEALASEIKTKKNALDSSADIINGIREWCLDEDKRIDTEWESLLDFVNRNWSLFCRKVDLPAGERWHRSIRSNENTRERYYTTKRWNRIVFNNLGFEVDFDNMRFSELSLYEWGHLVHNDSGICDKLDKENNTLDYWLSAKKYIAYREKCLKLFTEKLKEGLENLVLKEDNRFDEVTKACEDIDKKATETVTITIVKEV